MTRRPDSDLDFPDLELDTSAVRPKPAGAEETESSLDYFGKGTFDTDDFDLAGDLHVDLGVDPIDAGPAAAATRGVTATGRAWPSGASPDRALFSFEPLELAALGGYGTPPANVALTPLYAWRVLSGQRALRRRLATLARELESAEARRDDELGALVLELRPVLEGDSRFAGQLAPLSELEQKAQSEGRALASTQAERAAELEKIAQRRQNVERDLAVRRDEETRAAATLAEREHQLARVEAQHKRALIEIRAVEQLAQRAAAPGAPMPPELAARYTAEREKLAALEPELAARREAARAANAALALVRQKLGELERELGAVAAAARALDERYRPAIAARGQSARLAADQRCFALAEIGRAVLATRGEVEAPEAAIARIASADTEVERVAKENEKHLRALDAFDTRAFDRGKTLAMAVAVALLVLLLLAILL